MDLNNGFELHYTKRNVDFTRAQVYELYTNFVFFCFDKHVEYKNIKIDLYAIQLESDAMYWINVFALSKYNSIMHCWKTHKQVVPEEPTFLEYIIYRS